MRIVDLLPESSLRVQRIVAAAVILTQGGIAVTGAIVRVTASGLGCPTWPQCFPGSFTPVPHAEVPGIHQAVEFGNRLLTFLVVLTAAAAVIAVTRARPNLHQLSPKWSQLSPKAVCGPPWMTCMTGCFFFASKPGG